VGAWCSPLSPDRRPAFPSDEELPISFHIIGFPICTETNKIDWLPQVVQIKFKSIRLAVDLWELQELRIVWREINQPVIKQRGNVRK
jgi:hypothetical protein